MPFKPADAALPLTPISFEILLALLEEDRHGYAILQIVGDRLSGVLPMRTGTIYRALARLMDEGLIQKTSTSEARQDEPPSREKRFGEPDRRQRYRITARGRKIAKAEAERLADQVEAARARRLLPGARR